MLSFIILCLLLGLGHLLRSKVKLLRTLYLPSCVIGGLAGLIIIQSLAAADNLGEPIQKINIALSACSAPWSKLPGFLINVVFACLFIGIKLPKFTTLTRRAGPQLAYGQVVAWGQYVVGLGLWVIILARLWPNLPPIFAGILPVGFEGGHGTAAGMAPVFDNLGWAAGKDFALASATAGILSAIIVGTALINWAVRKGYVQTAKDPAQIAEDDTVSIIPVDKRPIAGRLTVTSDAIETFSLHIVVVAIAIALGFIVKQGLVAIETNVAYLTEHQLLSSFPLFPLCMLGGLAVQLFLQKFDKRSLIDLGLIRRIQNTSLDFLVVAAIATIKLNIILTGLLPLMLLVIAGIVWNVFCVVFLARRMLPDAWFPRAIAEMGQSMGVTATGLLLLRVVDPDYKTPAADAFACKQLLHEPFMGGGLWTGAAIPLIAVYGPKPILTIAFAALIFWLTIVFVPRMFQRKS